jgi:mannosyltransferase
MAEGSSARSGWAPADAWLQPGREGEEQGPLAGPLVLLTLLAAALRLYHLGQQSFWIDEALTWQGIRPGAGLSFWSQMADSIQGPLYPALLWPLTRAGAGEFLLRLPSAVAGTAAVPLLGLLAGRLWGRRVAILAALLVALSPFHVWYSQEARGYALAFLFAVLGGLFWLDMADRGPRPRTAVLYGLAAALGVWSNMSFSFLVAAQALAVPLLARPRGRNGWGWWGLAFLIPAVAMAPWLLKAGGIWAVDRLAPLAETGPALRGETTFTPWALPYAGFAALYGFSLGPSLRELHVLTPAALLDRHLILLLVAGLAGAGSLLAGLATLDRRRAALLLWIVVPVTAVTILAVRNVKPFNVRYLAVAVPWLLALAAAGVLALPRRLGPVVAVLILGLMAWSLGNHHFAARYAKADLRAAVAWVEARSTTADEGVIVPANAPVHRFYSRGRTTLLGTGPVLATATPAAADSALAKALDGRERCWLIVARGWNWDPHGRLEGALARAGRSEEAAVFTGCRVLSWRRTEAEVEDGA